jgi:hypothetical protein
LSGTWCFNFTAVCSVRRRRRRRRRKGLRSEVMLGGGEKG